MEECEHKWIFSYVDYVRICMVLGESQIHWFEHFTCEKCGTTTDKFKKSGNSKIYI